MSSRLRLAVQRDALARAIAPQDGASGSEVAKVGREAAGRHNFAWLRAAVKVESAIRLGQ